MSTNASGHKGLTASAWVQRWSHLVPAGGTVLDVACGHGRHMHWFARQGHPVLGIDRDAEALTVASTFGPTLQADLEGGPWPLPGEGTAAPPRTFAGVVVTHYLWRPLLATLVQSVAPSGALIYETFGSGQESVGRPSRPEFLLQPGELLRVCQSLHVVAYECGFLEGPERFMQRIAAVRPGTAAAATGPARYRL